MEARIPEKDKKPGLCYAVTDDGLELPVVDVTHPAFALEVSDAEVSAVIEETVRSLRASAALPPEVVRELPRKSLLVRGMSDSANTFMTGMMTYLHRLGPDNLGDGWANDIDRRVAKGVMQLSFRFRLRDVARALAALLAPALARPGERRPIELLNIAGGPAMDSLNALMLLQRQDPALLRGRSIRIRVLDVDAEGPHFGARAAAALTAPQGALEGLDVAFEHVRYDWTAPEALRPLVADFAPNALGAASSEGGLFDYAADEVIAANLATLRELTSSDFTVAGSVPRELATLDPRIRALAAMKNGPSIRYRGLDALRAVAAGAGWSVEQSLDSVAHHVFSLRKA